MKCASSLASALAAVVLGFLAVPAQAGPVSGIDLKTIAGEGADFEQVRDGCYWHRGHWHCPQHSYRRYYYYDDAYGSRSRERRRDRIVCGRYSYWDGNACQPGRRAY